MEAINALFNNLLTIFFSVAVAAAAVFLAWGGFIYMSAAGNPRQMESGKSAIVNAIVGLAIVFSARVIATMVQSALVSG